MRLHHVVFCVRPENQEQAAELWRALGLTFLEVDLAEEGLRSYIDWGAGIEIVAPTERPGTETQRFLDFLDAHGEGVYTVVVRTPEVDGPVAVAARHGASVRFRHHRDLGEIYVEEAQLTPVAGMGVTFLATNLEDDGSVSGFIDG